MDYVTLSDSGYPTNRGNPKLATDSARAGHRIFEPQTIGEALYFYETKNMDAIVIVKDPEVVESQLCSIPITMNWRELFPKGESLIQ